MFKILDTLIVSVCYLMALIGLWISVSRIIVPNIKRNMSVTRGNPDKQKKKRKKNPVIRHLEMLLYATYGTKTANAITTFAVISAGLFIITQIMLTKSNANIITKILISCATTALPYFRLRVKLHSIRIEASYEGEKLVTEINDQYRINYFNMIEAIDKTCESPKINKCPYSKKILFRLALAVKQYRNTEELDEAIKEFTFAIDTQWAILLANNISISIEHGTDVSESLNDIIEDIKDIKKIIEENKQINNEGFTMIRFVAPITYIASVLAAIKFFGFSFSKFFNYQIGTSLGLKFFVLSMGTIAVNYIVYLAVRKPKYDF